MEFVLRVMPLTSILVDALGVTTICLVIVLVLFGLFCIIWTLYFRAHIQSSGLIRLGYFNGPWILRIIFIALGICWGVGEVVRLSFFRQEGRVFRSLSQKWQQDMCKLYILSNFGFTEPCLFLTMSFLLLASLQWRSSAIMNPRWNLKTTGYVLLYCIPIFILNLTVVMVAPKLRDGKIKILRRLPEKFTSTYLSLSVSGQPVIACTYPVLCTILHGLFAAIVAPYLLLLGRRMGSSVINKKLKKRIYWLIFLASSCLPLRALLLGLSVLARQKHFPFEALAFSGFFLLFCCVVESIRLLVYLPVANSLALNRDRGEEAGGGRPLTSTEEYSESLSLITPNQSHVETSTATSLGRNSDSSTKRGSISFRSMIKDEASSSGVINEEEMGTFSPGFRLLATSSPSSPADPQMVPSSS